MNPQMTSEKAIETVMGLVDAFEHAAVAFSDPYALDAERSTYIAARDDLEAAIRDLAAHGMKEPTK